jgi:hypothetical protein
MGYLEAYQTGRATFAVLADHVKITDPGIYQQFTLPTRPVQGLHLPNSVAKRIMDSFRTSAAVLF